MNIQITPVIHFIIFTLLNCPPNVLWQQFLEQQFPGYVTVKATDDGGKGTKAVKKLQIGNTVIKLLLDQIVAAAVNTVFFMVVMGSLKGRNSQEVATAVKHVG